MTHGIIEGKNLKSLLQQLNEAFVVHILKAKRQDGTWQLTFAGDRKGD